MKKKQRKLNSLSVEIIYRKEEKKNHEGKEEYCDKKIKKEKH